MRYGLTSEAQSCSKLIEMYPEAGLPILFSISSRSTISGAVKPAVRQTIKNTTNRYKRRFNSPSESLCDRFVVFAFRGTVEQVPRWHADEYKQPETGELLMRHTPRAGVATLALICSVSIGALGAIAQTGGQPTGTSPGSGPPTIVTAQGQVNPSTDQAQAFVKSLEDFVSQTIPGFLPAIGASVPQDVQLKPMPPQAKAALPPEAQAALPQAQDHHVAKMDDNTILIIDPITRQVVGMITGGDDSSLALQPGQGSQTQPGQKAAPQPGAPGTK